LLFNINWAICQLFHGKNKLQWDEDDDDCFVLDPLSWILDVS
jgi:hypothetical protein